MREKVAVSACLIGVNSKYDGTNNLRMDLLNELKDKIVYVICPEVLSGLSTPRLPSEIKDEKVININGIDITSIFLKGSTEVLNFLLSNNIKKVYLKDGSPSCGVTYIYDGSFTHKRVKGMGFTTKILKDNNIEVIPIQ